MNKLQQAQKKAQEMVTEIKKTTGLTVIKHTVEEWSSASYLFFLEMWLENEEPVFTKDLEKIENITGNHMAVITANENKLLITTTISIS